MGKVVKKSQCPNCASIGGDTSKDNLAVYADGSTYCFACAHCDRSEDNHDSFVADNIKKFSIKKITSRRLEEKTCRKFGYGVAYFDGSIGGRTVSNEPIHLAKYHTVEGEEVAAKIRTKNKEFKCIGDMKKAGLFGQHLYEPNDRVFVTVCEGEIDAMSVAQVMGLNFPVVSVPTGAGPQTKKTIKQNMEWLTKFKHVVLCFDQDEVGRKSAKECAELFPLQKVKIATLPKKDANEMLVEGEGSDLKSCIWNAQTHRPDNVLSIDEIMSTGFKRPERGLDWPWPTLTKWTYGIQPGQLYTLGGGSGCGKTTLLKDVLFKLAFDHKKRIGIISLEQTPQTVLLKLAGSLLGKRLHVPDETVEWNEQEIRDALSKLQEHVFVYDHMGGQDAETVLNKITYMVRGLDCDYIILDHITALTAHVKDNKVNAIDELMAELSSIVHGLDCTIFAVSHLAKPGFGQSYEEGAKVSASAFRGSQSIQYWSTFMMGIERNKTHEDEDERHIVTLRILKDRFSGEADGRSFSLRYDKESDTLVEIDDVDSSFTLVEIDDVDNSFEEAF
jgi:twinkle protein